MGRLTISVLRDRLGLFGTKGGRGTAAPLHAAAGKGESDHLILNVIRPAGDVLRLSAALSDELQRVAVAHERFHALLRT